MRLKHALKRKKSDMSVASFDSTAENGGFKLVSLSYSFANIFFVCSVGLSIKGGPSLDKFLFLSYLSLRRRRSKGDKWSKVDDQASYWSLHPIW